MVLQWKAQCSNLPLICSYAGGCIPIFAEMMIELLFVLCGLVLQMKLFCSPVFNFVIGFHANGTEHLSSYA